MASVVLVGCTTGPEPRPEPASAKPLGWATFTPSDVPWTISAPARWQVTTSRSDPNPRYIVGVLRSWAGTSTYRRQFMSGPNSGSGASGELGQSAVLVQVELLWYPPDQPVEWNPGATAIVTRSPPSRWHEDEQNPGWTYRARKLCRGNECVSVLEWRGPASSAHDAQLAERIAESVELPSKWMDPTCLGLDSNALSGGLRACLR